MFYIEKSGTTFQIDKFICDESGYHPKTFVTISYDDNGYNIHFVSYETNLLSKRTENNTDVCADSCMELFMQFDPQNDKHYINIEINPNGVAYNSIRLSRDIFTFISDEDIKKLNIKTYVFDDRWEINYNIPVSYIKKFIPTYEHKTGNILRGNFYKCAEETDRPHYGCFSEVTAPDGDFHLTEFFAEFKLI